MLVSAVMPTRGRQRLAAEALDCYLLQTYTEKELVILDDADCPSFAADPGIDGVRYFLAHDRMNIPQKRNAVNSFAHGELIWHLDSDDWSAPERMAEQVERFVTTWKSVIGYHSMFFHNEESGAVCKYVSVSSRYALGASFCYSRKFWESHPFDERKRIGSDNSFAEAAAAAGQLDSVDAGGLMVARAHSDNSCPKRFDLYRGPKVTIDDLPAGYLANAMSGRDRGSVLPLLCFELFLALAAALLSFRLLSIPEDPAALVRTENLIRFQEQEYLVANLADSAVIRPTHLQIVRQGLGNDSADAVVRGC